MTNCNLRTRRCSQNVSTETWIRAAKFNLKNPIFFEDINKILTEFPRSGMNRGLYESIFWNIFL